MHLVIYFCGTGNPGEDFLKGYDYANHPDVKTIFVQGCHNPEVCNSAKFPDLKGFAERFGREVFELEEGKFKLSTSDLESKRVGIQTGPYENEKNKLKFPQTTTVTALDEEKEITSVTLAGFSRGGIAAFEMAKVLKKIAPHVEVDVVADQPVPGNAYQIPGSNAASVADCSDCTNIKNATVILGAYTGTRQNVDLRVLAKAPKDYKSYKNQYVAIKKEKLDENTPDKCDIFFVDKDGKETLVSEGARKSLLNKIKEGVHTLNVTTLADLVRPEFIHPEVFHENTSNIHRSFFSQLVPSLPPTAKRNLIVIPRESHHQVRVNAADGEEHLHMAIAKSLAARNYLSPEELARKTEQAKNTYAAHKELPPAPFPPAKQLQGFFGIKKQHVYRYLDKLHPQAGLRSGYGLEKDENLKDWWKRQDKKASRYSTELTKSLVATLNSTDFSKADEVKKLYTEADTWLIIKANSASSRYAQVESLRYHLGVMLEEKLGVTKQEIAQMNRKNLYNNQYFHNEWTKYINPASYFRTPATTALEKAIEDHSFETPSRESDQKLLDALNTWLEGKNAKTSKRFDLVIMMREQLEEVMENTYGLADKPESQTSLSQ
ncbi:hypothetical protein Lbir_0196 [Legionella birminghamensis]|uniref:Uncharacterized protein n=1 Tax=Legionella birminghamensis TaxID=28083 RepID=A0A378IAN7_9GAMM|nr:hypothetical protein [Legionella birminghamensis]KTC76127.1 hypothetical protein Lbir_0196 [Legionella birminghamensis]STX32249.1 Uncharacterised protein [Legionella birminghamensis]